MEGSCWCQMDGANGMPSKGLNIGYQLDPKWQVFVIYLVLCMHQFQKYHLLTSLNIPETVIVIRYLLTQNKLLQSYSHFFGKYRDQFQCSFIISSAILEPHYYKLLYQCPICVFVNYPCVCLPLKIGCTSKCDWVKSLLKEQSFINTSVF